jgi:hypothetical protein
MTESRNIIRGTAVSLLPYLAVLVLVSITYSGILSGNQQLLDRDLYWFFYQNSHYLADSIQSGRLPLWNPYINNGEPFLAQAQPGVLYPPHWLYMFFPVSVLFSRLLILHIALCGILTALLVREFGGGRTAAAIGGITIAFGGVISSLLTLQSSLFALTWLPLALWSLIRSLKRDSVGYAVLTGGVFSLMVFVGGMEILAMGPVRRVRLLAVSGLLFLLIGAVQILPFVELTRYSYRTQGIDPVEALTWSLHPREWIYFLIPDVFRHGRDFYWEEQNWLRTTYLGVVPLLLALACVRRFRGRALGIVLVGGICLLLASGGYLPVYRDLVPWLPGIRSIRYPSKFLMMLGFLVAIAAGLGWEQIRSGRRDSEDKGRFPRAYLVLSALAVLLLCLTEWLDGFIHRWLTLLADSRGYELTPEGILHNVRRCLALTCVTWLAVYLVGLGGRLGRIGKITIPLLIAMDLMGAAPYATRYYPTSCLDVVPERTAKLNAEDKYFRVFAHQSLWDRPFSNHEEMIPLGTDLFMPNATIQYHLHHSQGYRVLTLSRIDQIMISINGMSDPARSRLVDLLNIRYLLWPSEVASPNYTLLGSSDSLYFYENRGALERAFLADSSRYCASGIEYQKIMEDIEFDPRSTVLLDEKITLPQIDGGRLGFDTEEVQILRYQPERITIRVRCGRPKFLVLTDAYYPGWKAWVNNLEVKVHRADFAFRAVPVDAGENIVDFRYEPDILRLGATISAASFLTLTGLAVLFLPLGRALRRVLTSRKHIPELPRVETGSSHQ